jgi:hypothetical protein
MSARNGDKSRFHRVRKQKIQLRLRTRELVQASLFAKGPHSATASSKSAASDTKVKHD